MPIVLVFCWHSGLDFVYGFSTAVLRFCLQVDVAGLFILFVWLCLVVTLFCLMCGLVY